MFEYSFRIGYIINQRKRVWGPTKRSRVTVLGHSRMNKIELMCVVTGHIECVYLQNIYFSILQQFKQESPVFLKIVGLHTLGTGCDAKGV